MGPEVIIPGHNNIYAFPALYKPKISIGNQYQDGTPVFYKLQNWASIAKLWYVVPMNATTLQRTYRFTTSLWTSTIGNVLPWVVHSPFSSVHPTSQVFFIIGINFRQISTSKNYDFHLMLRIFHGEKKKKIVPNLPDFKVNFFQIARF
jgi:hypothetical protein